MSKASPFSPKVANRRRTFHIVASRFNAQYVDGLVNHVTQELRCLAPDSTVLVHRVPGSFEIPVVAREVAIQNKTDAIIACGVILQGETDHAQNLSRSVTDALQQIAIEQGMPVINAVLTFENENQARARCLENKINRGTEAARAAVEIAEVLSDVRARGQGAAVSKSPRDNG